MQHILQTKSPSVYLLFHSMWYTLIWWLVIKHLKIWIIIPQIQWHKTRIILLWWNTQIHNLPEMGAQYYRKLWKLFDNWIMMLWIFKNKRFCQKNDETFALSKYVKSYFLKQSKSNFFRKSHLHKQMIILNCSTLNSYFKKWLS